MLTISIMLELDPPDRISLTKTVPSSVPSLFHNSPPLIPSSALKNKVPPATVNACGVLPAFPGLMSLTRTVPAVVPSVFQSSLSLPELVPRKYKASPITVNSPMLDTLDDTCIVPSSVPFVFHNVDDIPSPTVKKTVSPNNVN